MNSLSKQLSYRYLLLLLLLLFSFSVQAIVIRHDKADSRYRVAESEYPQIFFLHTRFGHKICVATMISPLWAITAGHCTDQTPLKEMLDQTGGYSLKVAGKPNKIVSMVIHPNYKHSRQSQAVDLALLRLERPIHDIEPARLYTASDEQGQVVSFLGWGYTGIGTLGAQANDGKLRRAQNTVIIADQWLQFEFDDPRQREKSALALEGVPGLGDSGGPALLENENGLQILGVALGEVEESLEPGRQGRYGVTELYERISNHLVWIRSVLSEIDK